MAPTTSRPTGRRRPGRRARSVAALAAVAVAACLALVGGCGAMPSTDDAVPSGEAVPSREADPGAAVSAEIRQGRASWGDRVVQVRVLNDAADPVTVTGAELTVATVRGTARSDPEWERSVPAGGQREASVPLGAPICPAPSEPGTAAPASAATSAPTAEVRLSLRAADGRTVVVTRVAADPQGHLARIHAEDCAALAVARGLRVRPDAQLAVADRDGELVATVELVLVPVAGGPPVSVDRVDGTVLIAPLDGVSWTPPGAGVAVAAVTRVALPFRAGRCDAHAVAEDKRGTHLGLHTTVDGVPQAVHWVWLGDDLSGQVHDFIGAACGWPTG